MTTALREKAIIRAADRYADACNRLRAFFYCALDGPSKDWPEEYQERYDRIFHEVEQTRDTLLAVAKKA